MWRKFGQHHDNNTCVASSFTGKSAVGRQLDSYKFVKGWSVCGMMKIVAWELPVHYQKFSQCNNDLSSENALRCSTAKQ
ncbi:hypothetical protein NEUTE1DRAFT_119207, partial [Neurospora tetrasperma FGSC 2508]